MPFCRQDPTIEAPPDNNCIASPVQPEVTVVYGQSVYVASAFLSFSGEWSPQW